MTDLLVDLGLPRPLRSRRALDRALREAIRDGRLVRGTRLPSTRSLAAELGLARSTVVGAYEQLTAEGYLHSRRGSGTVVADVSGLAPTHTDHESRPTARPSINFMPGEPDCGSFPRSQWLASTRRVLATSPDDLLGYGDPHGLEALRRALVQYLGRVRGVLATPGRVSVFAGAATALGFLAETFVTRGITRIAVEDPGMPFHRGILQRLGLEIVGVPVDDDGVLVDAVESARVGAVLVTPAHQYPLGVTLSAERRSALVAWARRSDAWIVEDDYDGEFRYDRQPIGALQGLDPERVIYMGTASKSLAPGLRIGWVVLPRTLVRRVEVVRAWRGGASQIEQATLADMITTSAFDRHVRRMRNVYRQRRDLFVERLRADVAQLDVPAVVAGHHFTVGLPAGVDEVELIAAAGRRGIALFGLGHHWCGPTGPGGLVLGFSRPAQHSFAHDVEVLVRFLADALAPTPTPTGPGPAS